MPQPRNPAEFIEKWKPVTLPERAASQEHFIDLCRLLGQPTPAEHDSTGAEYAFEKARSHPAVRPAAQPVTTATPTYGGADAHSKE